MKGKLKDFVLKGHSAVAAGALKLAVSTANSTCFCFSHQPKEPAGLAKLKK